MDQRILFVISAIQMDLGSPLNTNDLAQATNLSPSRLRHLFRSEKGMTLVHYQRIVRMEEARVLLLTTFLSIKQVMTRVGIGDNSHFAHEFKKLWGLTPTMYRKAASAAFTTDSLSP